MGFNSAFKGLNSSWYFASNGFGRWSWTVRVVTFRKGLTTDTLQLEWRLGCEMCVRWIVAGNSFNEWPSDHQQIASSSLHVFHHSKPVTVLKYILSSKLPTPFKFLLVPAIKDGIPRSVLRQTKPRQRFQSGSRFSISYHVHIESAALLMVTAW